MSALVTRRWLSRLVVVVALVTGAVVTAWPVTQTMVTDRHSVRSATGYSSQIATVPASKVSAQLSDAQRYNAALPESALGDPWNDDVPASDAAHRRYLGELDATDAMARLRIPVIGVDLPVVHDADPASLRRGVGHMYGTTLPVGGKGTHAVLAAHTGWSTGTFFNRLPEVEVGDLFTIDVAGQHLVYRVDQLKIVDPDDISAIRRDEVSDHVTLVTCVEGRARRLLVRGTRVPASEASAIETRVTRRTTTTTTSTPVVWGVQRWMLPRVAISVATLALVAAMATQWIIHDLRHRKDPA